MSRLNKIFITNRLAISKKFFCIALTHKESVSYKFPMSFCYKRECYKCAALEDNLIKLDGLEINVNVKYE